MKNEMDCDCCYRELYFNAVQERDELAAKCKRLVQQKGELIDRVMRMERAEREREKANSGYMEVCGTIRWVKGG